MPRVPCAFSCSEEFLKIVDGRASSLGMNRSQYIVQVLRQDLITGRPNLNVVAEQAAVYGGTIHNGPHARKGDAKKIKYPVKGAKV